jgi:ribosomal protein S18 acetylase RimI-like enzyme
VNKLEPLDRSHNRDGFDCGAEPLNAFLKQTARQHGERGISRTFVLVAEESIPPKPVLGYFSLNLCQLQSEELPPAEARRFPKMVSGVRLGRLAVDLQYQRQGIGKMLLIGAMRRFMEIFRTAGGIGLFVDAKDENAKRYYEQFGFEPMPSNPLELFLPVKVIEATLNRADLGQ